MVKLNIEEEAECVTTRRYRAEISMDELKHVLGLPPDATVEEPADFEFERSYGRKIAFRWEKVEVETLT